MAFEPAITIKEAIDHIHNNSYLLPAIQREFVWWGTVKLTDLVPNQRLGKSLSC